MKSARIADGLANIAGQIAVPGQRGAGWTYLTPYMGPQELDSIYRSGWLGKKIIDVPAEDMTREWRSWAAEEDDVAAIEAVEAQFDLRHKVLDAKRWARLYGQSALIIMTGQGRPEQPLPDEIPEGLVTGLHLAVGQWEIRISEWDNDVNSPIFGEPLFYRYYSSTGLTAAGVKLHASRVIPFAGVAMPHFTMRSEKCWGDSVFQAINQTMTSALSVTPIIADLLFEAKVDVVTTPDLAAAAGDEELESRLLKRWSLANVIKSISHTLLLNDGETWEQKQINFAGISDMHARLFQEISGAADIPATRLLGQSPAGMNSTGESDLRNYYDGIAARQNSELRPALVRIDRVLLPSAGVKIADDTYFSFKPLWQETPAQKADVALKRAQTTDIYVRTAMVPDSVMSRAVVSQLIEDGTYPELDAAMKDWTDANGEYDPATHGPLEPPALEPGVDLDGNPVLGNAVMDAAPRTLYVSRPVLNADEIVRWAKGQGFATVQEDLHVTLAFSRQPVDWMLAHEQWTDKIEIKPGGPRLVEPLGNGGAVCLLFKSSDLEFRWQSLIEIGATWDHGGFQPHVTITWNAGDLDLSKVEPYQGKIVLGPERFAEINEDWKSTIVEDSLRGCPAQPSLMTPKRRLRSWLPRFLGGR